jgi:rubrerythrin
MDKEKALNVLKQGMNTEIWGLRFYQRAVRRTTSPEGKNVFKSLVEEEKRHLDVLRGQYAAISGAAKWVSIEEAKAMADSVDPKDIFPKATSAKTLIPASATDEQALQMAMEFEQRGYNMYEQEAKSATSPAEKAMWEWLAKAENAHYTYLQKTYDFLTTNGTWYYDDRELPIFYN